jgi:hypothetical protein
MSAAFGPGDRLRCVRGADHGDATITAGEIYTARSVGCPMPPWVTEWVCTCCSETDSDGVRLMERTSAFGWCPCHFRPTWDEETAIETTTKEREPA